MELELGDIVRIGLPSGAHYLQIINQRSGFPAVLRILATADHQSDDESAQDSVEFIARLPTAAVVMMPLAGLITDDELKVERLGRAAVPEEYRAFPTFRNPVWGKDGEILYWWKWDGESLSFEPDPDAVDSELPIRQVTSAEALKTLLTASEAV